LIDQQVHRITLIVNKLLQFARPSEFAGYDGNVRPSDVITDCLVLIQHLLNRSQIEVTRSKLATRVVAMNQTELQQVVLNLLVNALHAMPNGGTLSLRSRDVDLDGIRGVAIVVSDTGVGIPPENVNRIFDAFFTTKPRTGTGLGLSISYALVARHGGRMSVESVVGEGSTFTVWLPTDLKSMPIEGETAQSDP
jgi:signal transduction histidine kinase